MTLAIDIEDGREFMFPIDVCLCEGYQGCGDPKIDSYPPSLCLSVSEEYAKCGLSSYVWVGLPDLFDEYLRDYWESSHGEQTPALIKMLRDYANKIEADLAKKLAST